MLDPITAPLAALIAALSLLPLGGCAQLSDDLAALPLDSVVDEVTVEYGTPLPERAAVSDEWFENTAFIGHSMIQGLAGYGGLKQPDYYYLSGASVKTLLTSKQLTLPNGATGSLSSALSGKTYQRVYLMVGINEVAGTLSSLKSDYQSLIELVRRYNPEAEIYVLAVLPVSSEKNAAGTFTIARITAYNSMLQELCREQECWYVDLYTCFADENGCLPSSTTSDGIHLKSAQYAVLLDYLRTHTAPQ